MRLAPPGLALALALAACAHDVTARFPSTPGQATGRVALVFTDVADSVTVAIDGVLVVQGARTEHVVITGVPTGYADLSVAVGPTYEFAGLDNSATVPGYIDYETIGQSGSMLMVSVSGTAVRVTPAVTG